MCSSAEVHRPDNLDSVWLHVTKLNKFEFCSTNVLFKQKYALKCAPSLFAASFIIHSDIQY